MALVQGRLLYEIVEAVIWVVIRWRQSRNAAA